MDMIFCAVGTVIVDHHGHSLQSCIKSHAAHKIVTQYDPVWPSPISIHWNTCHVVSGCPLMSRPRAATSVAISTLLSEISHFLVKSLIKSRSRGPSRAPDVSPDLNCCRASSRWAWSWHARHARHGVMFQNDDGPRTGQSIHRHALGALVVRWLCSGCALSTQCSGCALNVSGRSRGTSRHELSIGIPGVPLGPKCTLSLCMVLAAILYLRSIRMIILARQPARVGTSRHESARAHLAQQVWKLNRLTSGNLVGWGHVQTS